MKKIQFYFFIIFLFIFTGCSVKNIEKLDGITKANVQKVAFYDIDGFYNDDLQKAFEVFKKACEKSKRYDLLKGVCTQAQTSTNAKDFFISNFDAYKLLDEKNEDKGTITGYYEPLLFGSLEKSEKYKYPIYKTPKDMIVVNLSSIYPELKKYRLRGKIKENKLIPYDTRADIENNKNKNLEAICYVDDKFSLFLLHIQGSGKVQLEDGTILNIGYANQNGRKYKSVGKYMLKNDYIKASNASIQGMKEFFDKNPKMMDEILNHNESYVFFRKSNQGATGSLGVELVKKRNIAVDRKYIPLGFPVFIQTKNPLTKEDIKTLMVAADTGGAIKGKIRADYFWGYGDEALKYAGKMKEKGSLFILVPKQKQN